jgi:hypothetical protein
VDGFILDCMTENRESTSRFLQTVGFVGNKFFPQGMAATLAFSTSRREFHYDLLANRLAFVKFSSLCGRDGDIRMIRRSFIGGPSEGREVVISGNGVGRAY